MRGLGTDHVISVPIRGQKKLLPMVQKDKQTNGHDDSMTEKLLV